MKNRDRILLYATALGMLALAVWLVVQQSTPDYRRYQSDFRSLVAERLGPERAAKVPEGPQQLWLPALGRVDRCTSCHVGVTWTDLEDVPQPFAAHPPEPLAHHPVEKFGCTVCHGGQGPSTQLPDAHGWVEHWEDPLLDKTLAEEYALKEPSGFLQMRCSGCHRYQQELRGAPLVSLGRKLMDQKGCRACHTINGRGGAIGPDLTAVGDKHAEQYDFSRMTSLKSLFAWHVGHLQNPKSFSPGSIMPEFGFSTAEAQAIALVLMSFRNQNLPAEYRPGVKLRDEPTPEQAERERMMSQGEGKFFVQKTCFVCHDVTVFGIESATKIGPDLSMAVSDVQSRFNRTLEDFLHEPTGTMQVVLSRQISLTPAELEEAIALLHKAHERHQSLQKKTTQ